MALALVLLASLLNSVPAASSATGVVENLTFNGQVDQDNASFILKGRIKGGGSETNEAKLIYSLHSQERVWLEDRTNRLTFELQTRIHQGQLKELVLAMRGQGNIQQVTGEAVRDWSVRHGTNGARFLVIRPFDPEKTTNLFNASVTAGMEFPPLPATLSPLILSAEQAAWQEGAVQIESSPALNLVATNASGLTLVQAAPATTGSGSPKVLDYHFTQSHPDLTLAIAEADPDARRVALEVFELTGDVGEQAVSFRLKGAATVKHPDGGRLTILSGNAALTAYPEGIEMIQTNGVYVMVLPRAGSYPIQLQFDAKLSNQGGWKSLAFATAPGALRPMHLRGLPAETQFQPGSAAKPERSGNDFITYLPPAGDLALQWKEAKTEGEGKLFYAVQGVIQMTVGPGLLRQAYFMEYQVLQGELTKLMFQLQGDGEVTRISGDGILSWKVEPGTNSADRRLVIQLNQAQKDRHTVTIQTQSPLGIFPLKAQPLRLAPVGAIRYGGQVLVVNDGAVRLEVIDTRGLSQISREQFPQIKELTSLLPEQRSQGFAYRFSGADFSLAIQADHIQPELAVSEVLLAHLSEAEVRLEAELELEIREAPLREFWVQIPADFTVSQLNAAQLSDYFVTPGTNAGFANLKLVFSQPLAGRQVVQLRLEKNQNFTGTNWSLPLIRPQQAKTVRGYVAATADTGLRLVPGRTEGLTEIAGAFFPRKVPGIQFAYRLRDNTWEASLGVERLTRALQVDAFHLFSISEGVAYGSSVLNYLIAGTPVSSLLLEVPADYGNVEFVGRDVRNWKKTDRGYEVFLHTPVFGAYTLLATFDRKFNAAGDTFSFAGPRPLDVQSEQGSVAVVSEYQFEVKNVNASTNATPLESVEIPAEQRLLFDAPLLAAYRYLGRPFTLNLTLNSLTQGDIVHQVVDRASLETRVSHEGEVVTRARYFVKSQGLAHLRVTLPESLKLWEASVNGAKVVPIADAKETLIPLPARASASALLRVDLLLGGKSENRSTVTLQAPAIGNPVLLTEWNVVPDAGFEIRYRQGDLARVGAATDRSGLAWIGQLLHGQWESPWPQWGLASLLALLLGTLALGWATRIGGFRFSSSNVAGLLVGLAATVVAVYGLVGLVDYAWNHPLPLAGALAAQTPITDAGKSLQMQVQSVALNSVRPMIIASWLPWLGLVLWGWLMLRNSLLLRSRFGLILGWWLLSWAVLVWAQGAAIFFGLVFLFYAVHVLWPAWQRQRTLPPKPRPPAPATAVAGTVGAILLAAVLTNSSALAADTTNAPVTTNVVRSLIQTAQVKEGFVQVQARMQWQAVAGQTLVLLRAPAVLTTWQATPSTLILREQLQNTTAGYELLARETGQYAINFDYQILLGAAASTNGFQLPTPAALVNLLNLEVERAEVEVTAPEAVSVKTVRTGKEGTQVALVLAPVNQARISWQPRSRDVRAEKAVFYAELAQLFIPAPGVIESVCEIQVRPAQGQLTDMQFTMPAGFTITDVQAGFVNGWRFDPDTRSLTVQFQSPQSHPFLLRLRSQLPAGALPYEQSLGVIQVARAAGQVGQAGIATGPEIQLDKVIESGLSAINLEDFSTNLVREAAAQVAGLTLRRAFRSTEAEARILLSASAVEPDIRVQSQETLSLGEDRIVLASQLQVSINRAGIFKLSFVLPADMEVESLSGSALSHWTEFATGDQRVVTLHLKARTEGECSFSVTLGGPGMQQRKEWEAPRLLLREATKHSGQLILVPEVGLRLHAKTREGVTQLDPQKAGLPQKGVLAFRLLHANWRLGFDVEAVEPWIELALLHDVTIYEGQAKALAQLQYQIENAGVKTLQVQVPAGAENVRFTGDNLGDTVRLSTNQNGTAVWEIKLQRRVIGAFALKLAYQIPASATAGRLAIGGLEGKNVNLQRGYLVVHSTGRLQLKMAALPATLQRTEWQAIPAALRRGLDSSEARDTFRIMEPGFTLNLEVARHEVAKLLPARIEKTELTSVLSSRGMMLTEVRLTMQPGDKRLLHLKLPAGGRFWHARVNQESAWPWRNGEEILIPLEKNTDTTCPATVEFVYDSPATQSGWSKLNLGLVGPQFDLPLENITWQVFVPEAWEIKDWKSSLQLVPGDPNITSELISLQAYLESEVAEGQEKTRDAENLLQMGNNLLQKGVPQQARRAFSAAWRLSQHDVAFNEDARVQLHNLKLQQALLGLNQRKTVGGPDADERSGKSTDWLAAPPGQAPAYTQQQVQKILEQNSAEENQALMRLADRLIRQQDAAMAKPESIRATLPKQGRLLTFTGSLQVETWKALQIQLVAKVKSAGATGSHLAILFAIFAGLAVLALVVRRPAEQG